MESERYEHRHLDLVCELTEPGLATRTEEWIRVKGQAVSTEALPGGVRVWLPAESAEMIRDLARREALCCGFLDIVVAVQDDRVRLDITSATRSEVLLIEFLSG